MGISCLTRALATGGIELESAREGQVEQDRARVVRLRAAEGRNRAPDFLWDTIASATQGRVVGAAGRRAAIGFARRRYEGSESTASPNGLPSESRQIAHRDPEWITLPPSALTWPSAVFMSVIVK
jgi:hypothetical protein